MGASGATCSGDRRVVTRAEFDALVQERCRSISGALVLTIDGVGSLEGLETLEAVGDYVAIQGHDLTSLKGLDNLETIGDYLSIQFTPIPSLVGLGSLRSLPGGLGIARSGIESLTGLEALTDVSQIDLAENEKLVNLDGLEGVSTLAGDLSLYGNPALVSLAGLHNLQEVEGLDLTDSAVTSFEELESLTHVGAVLNVQENQQLTSLAGLEQLTEVSLRLTGNPSLVSLTGLENITQSGALRIEKNATLATLAPLDQWEATAVTAVIVISGNPKLPQCEIEAFAAAQTASKAICYQCTGNGGGTCD